MVVITLVRTLQNIDVDVDYRLTYVHCAVVATKEKQLDTTESVTEPLKVCYKLFHEF